jgi:hypothetical protein
VIVVVGHGGFLHYLTNDWSGIGDAEHGKCVKTISGWPIVIVKE